MIITLTKTEGIAGERFYVKAQVKDLILHTDGTGPNTQVAKTLSMVKMDLIFDAPEDPDKYTGSMIIWYKPEGWRRSYGYVYDDPKFIQELVTEFQQFGIDASNISYGDQYMQGLTKVGFDIDHVFIESFVHKLKLEEYIDLNVSKVDHWKLTDKNIMAKYDPPSDTGSAILHGNMAKYHYNITPQILGVWKKMEVIQKRKLNDVYEIAFENRVEPVFNELWTILITDETEALFDKVPLSYLSNRIAPLL